MIDFETEHALRVGDFCAEEWSVKWTENEHMHIGHWKSSGGDEVKGCTLLVLRPAGAVRDWRWEVHTPKVTLRGRGHRSCKSAKKLMTAISEAYWRNR